MNFVQVQFQNTKTNSFHKPEKTEQNLDQRKEEHAQ